MEVRVKADIDPNLIAKRTAKADHALAVEAAKDTEKFVPMLNGGLREGTRVSDNKIIYPPPYAHYHYVGIVYVDPKTGAAGFLTDDGWKSRKGIKKIPSSRKLKHKVGQDHWFEPSKAVNMDKWLNFYKKALTNEK